MKRYLRWAKVTVAALGAALVLGTSVSAEAQRGGSFGGRGFGGYRGYSGSYGRGYSGGYRGFGYGYRSYGYRPGFGWGYWGPGVVYRPYGFGYGVYRVGAMGALVLVAAVAGLLYAAIIVSRRRRAMGRPLGYDPYGGVVYEYGPAEEPVQVIKAQLALLATARNVSKELERIATSGDSSTPQGLGHMLRETAILLARAQPYWKAGFLGQETFEVSEEAERRFEEAVVGERVKLDGESLTVENGRIERSEVPAPAEPHKVGRYIVVTLLVAVAGPVVEDNHTPSSEEMKVALTKLASIPGGNMRALEVIWAPSDPEGALDEDDLLLKYSALSTF
jgi:uncharacterized membrane protein